MTFKNTSLAILIAANVIMPTLQAAPKVTWWNRVCGFINPRVDAAEIDVPVIATPSIPSAPPSMTEAIAQLGTDMNQSAKAIERTGQAINATGQMVKDAFGNVPEATKDIAAAVQALKPVAESLKEGAQSIGAGAKALGNNGIHIPIYADSKLLERVKSLEETIKGIAFPDDLKAFQAIPDSLNSIGQGAQDLANKGIAVDNSWNTFVTKSFVKGAGLGVFLAGLIVLYKECTKQQQPSVPAKTWKESISRFCTNNYTLSTLAMVGGLGLIFRGDKLVNTLS